MSEVDSIQVKREGYAWSSDDSGHAFAVFDRAAVEAAIGPVANVPSDQLARQLTGWSATYRGPGRSFRHEPHAKLYRHAVLVTQHTGLDI